jgi:hypothetical protein
MSVYGLLFFLSLVFLIAYSPNFSWSWWNRQKPVQPPQTNSNWVSRPSRIVMIRHGEKNATSKNGCFPDADLNAEGLARVQCLVSYFGLQGAGKNDGKFANSLFPMGQLTQGNTIIYAKAVTACCGSTRPIVTISGVAKKLGFGLPMMFDKSENFVSWDSISAGTNPVICQSATVDANQFNVQYSTSAEDEKQLANTIKTNTANNGKTIIICWEHDNLTNIIANLFPSAPAIYYNDLENPTQGKIEDVFDRTWVFTFAPNSPQVTFEAFYNFSTDPNTKQCLTNKFGMNRPSFSTTFNLD